MITRLSTTDNNANLTKGPLLQFPGLMTPGQVSHSLEERNCRALSRTNPTHTCKCHQSLEERNCRALSRTNPPLSANTKHSREADTKHASHRNKSERQEAKNLGCTSTARTTVRQTRLPIAALKNNQEWKPNSRLVCAIKTGTELINIDISIFLEIQEPAAV